MKKIFLSISLMLIASVGYCGIDYQSNIDPINPTFTGTITGSAISISGNATISSMNVTGSGTSFTASGNALVNGNSTIGQTSTAKHLVVTSTMSTTGVVINGGTSTIDFNLNNTSNAAGWYMTASDLNSAYLADFNSTARINANGYLNGDTRYRRTRIMNGRNQSLMFFEPDNNRIQISPSGDLLYASTWTATGLALNGDVTISSRPCVSFEYFLNNSSVTEMTANTFTVLCGTGTMAPGFAWFKTAADIQGNSNRVTYVGPNTHKFDITILGCISDFTATATTASLQIRKGGNLLNLAETSPYIAVQNTDVPFSVSTIGSLATNDYIEIWGTTDDGDDVAIDHMQIKIVPID